MSLTLSLPAIVIVAFGVVRDVNGRPKFADPQHIPPDMWKHLSEDDRAWALHLQRQRATS